MAKSKYHLIAKRNSGKFRKNDGLIDVGQRSKRVKRQRRQNSSSVWLRTRKRIRNKLLR